MSIFRQAVSRVLAPGGPRGKLSILLYHRVLPKPDPLRPTEVSREQFDAEMALLARYCSVLSLTEAVHRLRRHALPPAAVCITFDDGYADNAEQALPILKRHGLPATFFIATDYLDGGRMWNDTVTESIRAAPGNIMDLSGLALGVWDVSSDAARRATVASLIRQLKYLPMGQRAQTVERIGSIVNCPLPTDLMMRSEQVKALRDAGMEIGGHTAGHPILASIDAAMAREEIARGKATLEALLKEPVKLFAYPNGKPCQDYLTEHVTIVKSLGFDAAVSTAWGVSTATSDTLQLPRFTPWGKTPMRFMLQMLRNMRNTNPQTI